ncbi:ABC transporter substrate-binding protein [Streptomyces viridochromogenes]|uniref:ABC transporter substrate-binding protein n=1 Tax=Streptomyces viridochromogenes TaxID=1938 RepID=A0A0J7ZID8_STRVR|nr:sugar ABC transporter substrate-binding protein [Streptomyces viridochromogenes]KMS75202.1 ABC transporter substrate-binding protein [Streptomyces viridochromogenes]KOG09556.1 ABC transporter substrate-binding protein [Streptomyces viridochromogenes]KOG09895.1 ABC transporter substrate-binding protein [Streptomyces viridochromogenes]
MKLLRARPTITAASAVLAVLALATTACNRESDASTSAEGGGKAAIGIDLPRSDTDFWNSYAEYLKKDIKAEGANALPISNSQNDVTKLVSNVQVFENTGAKAIVMAPQDTGAIASTLDNLASKKIPVISVDTRPDKGDVYMVVRADNRAYGTKACEYLGKQLGGKGKVAEFQGALDSINGRDRSEAFAECMKKKFPKIKVFELPTDWKGDVASAKLQSLLAQHPDLNGIYMQAGGAFLQPTLALLEQKGLLKPAGQKGHITIVSNDGIPQEFDAIRKGHIDATVSQPADLYAKYALYYAQAAAEGKTFKPGPTDHDSTIIKLPNGLEDQLAAPLVTKDNVDDKTLWGNNVGK